MPAARLLHRYSDVDPGLLLKSGEASEGTQYFPEFLTRQWRSYDDPEQPTKTACCWDILRGGTSVHDVCQVHDTWYMPTATEVASGRIFPVSVYYGKIVFVTWFEQMILLGSNIGLGMAILFVAATVYVTRDWS